MNPIPGCHYITRDGRVVKVVLENPGKLYPLYGYELNTPFTVVFSWTTDGYYFDPLDPQPEDIIESAVR